MTEFRVTAIKKILVSIIIEAEDSIEALKLEGDILEEEYLDTVEYVEVEIEDEDIAIDGD